MKPIPFVLVACLLAWVLTSQVSAAAETKTDRPNIIFILADDLGDGDLGCYGHPYARTPSLDQLAHDGSMFRNFHVTGVTCCPSRTGFMTGKFPATFHGYPADQGFGNRVTITELLKKAGYRTGHFGKWHIGPDQKPGTYGIDVINSDKHDDIQSRKNDPRGRDAHIYDDAIKFIEANKDVPFYMNVWDHIPHFPVNPPKSYSDKFKDLVVNDADFYYSETLLGKFALVRKAGGDVNQHMANYLGDVTSMDECIGRLLAKIDELGLRDKTMIIFSSDQGAAPIRLAPELGGPKDSRNEKMTRGDKAELRLNMLGYGGIYKGGKHEMFEGGVRVPFIIRWPGHVPAGRVEEKSLISAIDWLPTLCHIAGAELPSVDFDGEDVSDVWLGASRERSKPLFWKTNNVRSEVAVLEWPWKFFQPGARKGEKALYDLSNDPGEKNNLLSKQPEAVTRLSAKIAAWNATLPATYSKSMDKDD